MISNQLEIKNYFNLIKNIYRNPTSKIMLNNGNQEKNQLKQIKDKVTERN